jgi:conjugative transfer signal peptidase TraF
MGWRPPLRRVTDSNWLARDLRRPKRVRIVLAIFATSAVLVGAAGVFDLRVNWTDSMPRGIYQRMEPVFERGAWVAVCLEGRAAKLARGRGYVIDGPCASGLAPVFKRVVGVPGDRIEVAAGGVVVNGAAVAHSELQEVDSQGRSLEHAAEGEFVLPEGHFFVMGMNPSRSWDSRYFGAVSAHQIVAGARPLWTF